MTKKTSNRLVGAKVLIDWPVRWKGVRADYIATAKATAESEEHYYGLTGEIVATHPPDDRGRELMVRLDGGGQTPDAQLAKGIANAESYKGQLIELYTGAVTVTELPASENEILQVLCQMQAVLDKIERHAENVATHTAP